MKRRDFLGVLGGAAAAWPGVARAQQPGRTRRIGVLFALPESDPQAQSRLAVFRGELKKLGWPDITIDTRFVPSNDAETHQRYAKELVALQPDLLISQTSDTTKALLQQTRTIPIIFTIVADPIGGGFVASFSRPGGNVTGFVTNEPSMGGKWLELLREIAPNVTRILVPYNTVTLAAEYFLSSLRPTAVHLGIDASSIFFRDMSEFEAAVAAHAHAPLGGLVLFPDAYMTGHRLEVISLVARYRWLTKLSPGEQELVIAHERSHLGAHDTQLLTIAVCLLACMPWNPMLWWQLRRLRLAIEIDCDARVLSLGYPVARYSETLIAIGERQSASYAMTMARYGSKSFLEQRIHNMLRKKTRHARVSALALACLGGGLAVCAAQVAHPKVDFVGKTSSQEISADPQLLQANGQPVVRALRSQVLLMQAEGIADKLAQFIKESQSQIGWITMLPPTHGSADQRRFDALRLLRQVPAITELSLLDAEGKEFLKVSRLAMDVVGSGIDYSREAKFTETVAKKVYYGPVYMRREREPYMTMGMAGHRFDGGASVVELNLKPMWDIVRQTKVGDHGVAYVVDAEGRVIAHPDFDVGKSLRDVSSLAQVQEARTTPSTGSVRLARNMNDQEVAVVYTRVAGPGWLVFVELPIGEWTKN